jgi:RNase adapter protein RapZ
VPELRAQHGRDQALRDYVLSQRGAKEFLDAYTEVLRLLVEGYEREGKHYVTLAVGCTGGKHRSVAMAEQLGGRLRDEGLDLQVVHRDLGRE